MLDPEKAQMMKSLFQALWAILLLGVLVILATGAWSIMDVVRTMPEKIDIQAGKARFALHGAVSRDVTGPPPRLHRMQSLWQENPGMAEREMNEVEMREGLRERLETFIEDNGRLTRLMIEESRFVIRNDHF
mgnify:FL=1